MSTLRLVLADQLSDSLAGLRDLDPGRDTVLLCEVMDEATYVRHHPQKIAFLFAAMRHFAARLAGRGVRVRYVALDAPGNTGSLGGEVARAVRETGATRVVLTEPGEQRVLVAMRGWSAALGLPVELREDDRFFCSRGEFAAFARGKKQLRMELFYREMRRRHGFLLEPDGEPTGGAWNYDKENRKPPREGMRAPPPPRHAPSDTTRDVLALVAARFGDHFGRLEPFAYAVTREDALVELAHFIEARLPSFGDYQDAMVAGEPHLYHSRLSAYLNAGLLLPGELCEAAEAAFRAGRAPLAATEGFIRQILGWREFIRGIYWHHMPRYASLNVLDAREPLPAFYWGAPTGMFCVAEAVRHTRDHAYSHHIQRLMVTGNFALLAGLDVQSVCDWYLAVYADAYEWVELPNTLGMALHADGGIVGSKPYAASGKYIDRMSDSCGRCTYDPEDTLGDRACPFNALYWDFLARHEDRFRKNPRMANMYGTWARFAPERQAAIRAKARDTLARMRAGTL